MIDHGISNRHQRGNIVKLTLKHAVTAVADLLFPQSCVHCGAAGSLFCQGCRSELTVLGVSATCRRCALPSPQDTCETCFLDPPALDRAIAAYSFDPALHDAITAFKYGDIRALAPVLGHLLARALPAAMRDSIDVVLPVPMSGSRHRQRGYNQAELLAREVARMDPERPLRLDMSLLVRSVDRRPQAGSASIAERAANVADAFSVAGGVHGLRVLLVDDVMTTGSTLNACAAVLKTAGAGRVGALVLAREL
jgi:ComF family protein